MLKQQIAAELEVAFSQLGFAEPSVAQLKKACSVSLRTLYKYFPSKEEMIVGALEHRHQRYIALLEQDVPSAQQAALLSVMDKLEGWMLEYAPTGCMSMNAISAFPENEHIVSAVDQHKKDVRALLSRFCGSDELGTAVFLLHEGVSSAWPLLGKDAVVYAKNALKLMIK
ncbi:transcriptional regulator TetR family [Vibrio astriarenae]|nr:transcriptional regulator TetR family [Vibrio sp. C7]